MFESLGVNSPVSGAAGIATLYAAVDLLSSPDARLPSMENILIASMMANWLAEEQAAGNVVTVTTPGSSERFVRLPDGTFNHPLQSSSSLVPFTTTALHPAQKPCPTGTIYQYITKAQQETCFDALGNVLRWSDPNGMALDWSYDSSSHLLTQVTNSVGRSLGFQYDSFGKLSVVSDSPATGTAHTVSYARDNATGDLVVTGPDTQPTHYSFDVLGRMDLIVPPTFSTTAPQVTINYDVLDRVGGLMDAFGHTTGVYATGRSTETVDPAGHTAMSYYDDRGNLIATFDSLGNQTTYGYDGLSRVVQKTLPEGNSFAYTYDKLNNLLREDDTPKAGSGLAVRTATFQYDTVFNRTTYAKDFDLQVTRWGVDSNNGRIISETDPTPTASEPAIANCLGQTTNTPTTCFGYAFAGPSIRLVQVNDPVGKITKYAYGPSPNYNLITATEDAGSSPHLDITTTYGYDNVGNLSSAADPYAKTTGYAYDANRRLTSVDIPYDTSIGALRRPMTIGRDAYGRVICTRWQTNTTIPAATSTCPTSGTATGAAQTTATTYTATGQVKTQTDASGRVVSYGYDALDRALYARDAIGKVVSWSYDFNSRLAQVCKGFAAINTAAVCAGQTVVEKRNYTANSLLRGIQHYSAGTWNQTTYLPDGFDRAGAQVSYPDGTKELRTWSAAGDLKTFTPRSGTATSYTYDALHRPISRSGSWSASYGYDLASHPLSVGVNTAADGVAAGTWYWGYDSAGRLISEVQPNISTLPVRYELDLNGLRDSTFWPDGAEYYLADNYNYVRIRGDLTLPSQSTKTLWQSFPDPFDRATNLNLLPSTTIYAQRAFDAAGGGLDIASVTNGPAGGPTLNYTYSYDTAHRLTGQNVANAAPLAHPATANTLAGLTANKNNQVLNAAAGQTLSYDTNGHLTGDGVRTYTYAAEGTGRMLSATMGATSASYSYDPFGRRIAKTVGGVTTRFLFDAAGREIGEYDNSKNLLRRLLWHPDFTAPLAFASAAGTITYQATDRLGSVVATYSSSGALTNTYSYLAYGDTASGTISGTAFGYAGYRYDSETATYHTATRSYDPRLGRFLQTDPIGQNGGLNIYAYTGGNPLGGTDSSGHAPGDGAFRDGSEGTSFGGSQSAGGVGVGGYGGPNTGGNGGLGSPGHTDAQNATNSLVAQAKAGYTGTQADYAAAALAAGTLVPDQVVAAPPALDIAATSIALAYPGSATVKLACGGVCLGAAAGTAIEPGLGTVVGAGIGFGVTILSGIYILHNEEQSVPDVPVDPEYSRRALEKMNGRGISPADVDSALSDPSGVSVGESGNTVVDGKNGVRVIVDPGNNTVVSVHRPKDK